MHLTSCIGTLFVNGTKITEQPLGLCPRRQCSRQATPTQTEQGGLNDIIENHFTGGGGGGGVMEPMFIKAAACL